MKRFSSGATAGIQAVLDQVRDSLSLKRHSYRTEQAYVCWISRYVLFHNLRHSKHPGAPEVEAFFRPPGRQRERGCLRTESSSQCPPLPVPRGAPAGLGPLDTLRAKRPRRLRTALTQEETRRLLGQLSDIYGLMARLLHGSGLRLMECLHLRAKDLEVERRAIVVRDGKGEHDRVTILPDSLSPMLEEHLIRVKRLHEEDLARGNGAVCLPDALERKYPYANREWGWRYVFPCGYRSIPTAGLCVATPWMKAD